MSGLDSWTIMLISALPAKALVYLTNLIESFINLFIHSENNWERRMSQTIYLESFGQQQKIIKASIIPGITMDFFPLSFVNSNELSNFRPWGWNRIKTLAPTMKIMHVLHWPPQNSASSSTSFLFLRIFGDSLKQLQRYTLKASL